MSKMYGQGFYKVLVVAKAQGRGILRLLYIYAAIHDTAIEV